MIILRKVFLQQTKIPKWRNFSCFSSIRFGSDKTTSISDLFQQIPIDSEVTINGWIKALRKHKDIVFMQVNDGTCVQHIQVVLPSDKFVSSCNVNTAVEIKGHIVKSPSNKQPIEIHGQEIKVVGDLDFNEFPFAPRKTYPADYIRQFLHLRPKTSIQSSILRLSSLITSSLFNELVADGYVHVYTPILTSNDCEGAGESFVVHPESEALCKMMSDKNIQEAYFNKKVYLTVSGQLHLEAITGGLPKVFTLNPAFRAENSRSRRHLAEFRMLEVERAFCYNLNPILEVMEHLVKGTSSRILEHGGNDLAVVEHFYKENVQKFLESIKQKSFETVTYKEAMKLLLKNKDRFKVPPEDGSDFGKEHEMFIVSETEAPTFVVDWPSSVKPFYMRMKEENEELVSCVDLLVPDIGELCGGSLREHRYHVLKNRLENMKLEKSLDWYLQLRKCGMSPTGGFGMGVERLICFLLKIPNIKDVIPFPRTPHSCAM